MTSYLLLLRDVNQIGSANDRLRLKCERAFEAPFLVYQPVPFVEHTGYTETVADEIEYVIGCQRSKAQAYLTPADFAEKWGFRPFLRKQVLELSGGWKKFLGLALFSNRVAQGKLFLDTATHLSDKRLADFLNNIQSGQESALVFCEYDVSILEAVRTGFQLLLDTGDRIEPILEVPQWAPASALTNYAHP